VYKAVIHCRPTACYKTAIIANVITRWYRPVMEVIIRLKMPTAIIRLWRW